jgi:MFS family permease
MLKFRHLLFFILIYFNEGFYNLSDQCLYYLFREEYRLSATAIGLIGFFVSLSWYIKIIWGWLVDYKPIKKSFTKYYLYITMFGLLFLYGLIVFFPLKLFVLVLILSLINCCIGLSDVCCDKNMVICEQKFKLQGKLQSLQWASLGIAGLITSILGAWIADKFTTEIGLKICYTIAGLIPLITLGYLKFGWRELEIKKEKVKISLKKVFEHFKKPQVLFSLAFIACMQLCPSFGTPLMIKCREVLHIDKMFLGYLGATGTVLGIVGYLLYYWKFHKYNLKKLLYFTVIFGAITNLFYLYIPNQWILLGYNILFGAFGGITFLTVLAFFTTLVPKGNEGFCYACITALSNLCGKGGSVIGGILYDTVGYNWTVIVSTACILGCLFFINKLNIDKS